VHEDPAQFAMGIDTDTDPDADRVPAMPGSRDTMFSNDQSRDCGILALRAGPKINRTPLQSIGGFFGFVFSCPAPDGAARTAREPLLLFRSVFTLAALLRSDTRAFALALFQLPPRNPAPSCACVPTPVSIRGILPRSGIARRLYRIATRPYFPVQSDGTDHRPGGLPALRPPDHDPTTAETRALHSTIPCV
jgi:hypothetical protein